MKSNPRAVGIAKWLGEYIAQVLDLQPQAVDYDQVFARFGLDSVTLIAMTGDLGEWLGCEIDPALVYDHPSISALSRSLADRPDIHRTFLESTVLDRVVG